MWAATAVLMLAALGDGGVELAAPDAGPEHAAAPATPLFLRGAVEADVGLFPSGFGANGVDVTTALRPVIAFGVGDDFVLELGPTFRLRVADFAPDNRTSDVGGVLRGADWDELSDFGQILQELRVGHPADRFFLRAGPTRKKSLGLGHLLWRYSNQLNPNYHPASGELAARVGPVRGEFFASDVLGGRLFGGEVAWDIGGTFSSDAAVQDRYGLAVSAVHDVNRAGRPFRTSSEQAVVTLPPVTLLHVDLHAVLVRSKNLRWMLLAGLGTRATREADLGLLFGTALDATVDNVAFSTRVEVRKQAGGFRQGFFGPAYELQRFADIGLGGVAIQDARFPDSGSAFGEVRVGVGTHVTFEVAAEYFFWNRLDLDGGLSLALLDDWLYATLRSTVLGLLQTPRYAVSGGLRWRLLAGFYVLAEGGTLFFPQPDGALVRGVMGSVGVGIDFEKR